MREWVVSAWTEPWYLTKARQFEALRVRWLLQELRLTRWQASIRELDPEGRDLTFRGFDACFRTFPLRLGARWIHHLEQQPDCRVSALFRRFERSPLCRKFLDFTVEVEAQERERAEEIQRPIGLVMPWINMQQGLLIHDAPDLQTQGLKWVIDLRDQHAGRRLFVEPFRRVVKAIVASGWSPME